jgi:hypothetical protein
MYLSNTDVRRRETSLLVVIELNFATKPTIQLLGYGMDHQGSIRVMGRDLLLCHEVTAGSAPHLASYLVSARAYFRGDKAAGF